MPLTGRNSALGKSGELKMVKERSVSDLIESIWKTDCITYSVFLWDARSGMYSGRTDLA